MMTLILRTVLHLRLAVPNLRLGLQRMLLTRQLVRAVQVGHIKSEEISADAKRVGSGV